MLGRLGWWGDVVVGREQVAVVKGVLRLLRRGESYACPDLMYPSQQHMTKLTALPSTTVAKATHLLATRTRRLNNPAMSD